jgi:hypothetical protein
MNRKLFWYGLICLFLAAMTALVVFGQEPPTCDASLWDHVYHRQRLVVQPGGACVVVTGTFVDASHGRTGDGCRHEADGDGHCWLKLDASEENFLNSENLTKQEGNLVVEPMAVYRVKQPDAKAATKNFHQSITWRIGDRVRVTGAWVLDTEHGHMEIHPVTSIQVLDAH